MKYERFYTTTELRALASRVHAMNVGKGFWGKDGEAPPEGKSLRDKLVMVSTEVAEMVEDYREPGCDFKTVRYEYANTDENDRRSLKPIGFPTEAADIHIRLLDLAGAFLKHGKDPFTYDEAGEVEVNDMEFNDPMDYAFAINETMFGPHLEKFAVDSWGGTSNLLTAIIAVEMLCRHVGADLRRAVEAKLAYNEGRPQMHGKRV